LGIETEDLGYPYIVIEYGRVLDENLRLSGHDRRWLDRQLKQRNIPGPQQVYVMIVYDSGQVYLAEKEARQ
jgi:uncharacterized membrane protein YcaP (DUF421 family)